ncbi:MAG: hypothetical protein ABI789_03285 [Usitatibacter sp.]
MIRSSGPGLTWLALSVAYLAASAFGERGAALAALGLMVGAVIASSGHRAAGAAAGLVLAVLAWRFADAVRVLVFIPPLAAFAFMAYFFGRTLRAGSEPLINRIARKEHPDLPRDMARHARWLTGLWTACFVVLFIVALMLAPFLTLEAWSRSVQLMGYVVPSTLFLGEYIYRHRRFAHRAHGSLAVLVPNVLAVIRESALESGRRPDPEGRPR